MLGRGTRERDARFLLSASFGPTRKSLEQLGQAGVGPQETQSEPLPVLDVPFSLVGNHPLKLKRKCSWDPEGGGAWWEFLLGTRWKTIGCFVLSESHCFNCPLTWVLKLGEPGTWVLPFDFSNLPAGVG